MTTVPVTSVEEPVATPTAYFVSGDSFAPIAIEYLRNALVEANIPVIEIHHTVDTIIEPQPAFGEHQMILVNPYAKQSVKDRMAKMGLPVTELILTTNTVNNLRVIHGVVAMPHVTLGGELMFPTQRPAKKV